MAMDLLDGGDVMTPKVLADDETSDTKLATKIGKAGVERVFRTKEGKTGGIVEDRGITSEVIENHGNNSQFMRNFEHVIKWLCGLWAFGIGFRFTIELLASTGWIHLPKHPINIWFDFFPLCILGVLTVFFEVRNLILIACTGKLVSDDVVHV
jgi:hypothetical protein